jgi:hypothetical protein
MMILRKQLRLCSSPLMGGWRLADSDLQKVLKEMEKAEMKSLQIAQKMSLAMCTALLAGCTMIVDPRQALQAPQVPEALMVSADEQLAVSMLAEGVQIYQCQPSADDNSKFVWTFSAPEAVLYDSEHNELGKHYAGPTWEANDGSKVVGEVKARADAPTAGTIPWLLLTAKSNEGAGTFSDVTSIHRVETTGGQAPTEGCDQAHQNEEARAPYTAVYYFYANP